MTLEEVMAQLERLGNEQTRKTLLRHGASEPLFGVRIGDLKGLRKALNKNHPMALDLYATGNSDAMYLAGLIADEKVVTKAELNRWVKEAPWSLIANTTVAALAAESRHALCRAQKWIDSSRELVASAGWSTLSHHLSISDHHDRDRTLFEGLLDRVVSSIHDEKNEVKAAMNGFVIALGAFDPNFTDPAKKAAQTIGTVEVDYGKTSCKTPDVLACLAKIEAMGRVGRKKKSARC